MSATPPPPDWRQAPPPAWPAGSSVGPVGPAWRPPPAPSPLPLTPTRYPGFWRAPRWAPWRPLVIIVVGAFVFILAQLVALLVGVSIDAVTGRTSLDQSMDNLSEGTIVATPAFFLANNVGLGLLIPTTGLLAWWIFGQRLGWLSSVAGRLRWKWMLTVLVLVLPIWLVVMGLDLLGSWRDLQPNDDTIVLIVGIMLTTPLQAAGEEYAFRGALNRAVGSFFRTPVVGLVVGGAVSSGAFMLAHGAGDTYLNAFYFIFGAIAAWLTWRTGGLEAAIAIHVVNNLVAESTMPFSDISDMFDRGAGTASIADIAPVLIPLVLGLVVVEILLRTRLAAGITNSGPAALPGSQLAQ